MEQHSSDYARSDMRPGDQVSYGAVIELRRSCRGHTFHFDVGDQRSDLSLNSDESESGDGDAAVIEESRPGIDQNDTTAGLGLDASPGVERSSAIT